MFKKGDLTINVIVIAVIALLVLVILVAIFSGRMGIFTDRTGDALDQRCEPEGMIRPFADSCPDGRYHSTAPYADVDAGFKCCMPQTS